MHAKRSPSMSLLAGAIALALAVQAHAGFVTVGGGNGCTLADAINTTNSPSSTPVGSCTSGPGPNAIGIIDNQTLSGELPTIILGVAIFNSGPGTATITGDGTHRLFMIGDPNNAPTVSFSGLTLSGGKATGGAGVDGGGGGGGLGGAIFVYDGSVSLNQMTLSANAATGGASSGTPSANSPFTGVYIGSGGGGGGGMFGSGGSAGHSPPPVFGGDGVGGGFGSGGGGGGTNAGEFGGLGNGGTGGTNGGAGGTFSGPTPGGPGAFGGGGGGGGPSNSAVASQPGGSGGFGGGGGGGAGQCSCNGSAAGGGAPGGFGGGGGAGGSFTNTSGVSGGGGGFGGGGGSEGYGQGGGAIAGGGFGGGDSSVTAGQPLGGGGGAGLGGAVFIRSGHLDIQSSALNNNTAMGGGANANANPGLGKGGAIFAVHILADTNGNDQGMPTTLPTVSGCANTFSGSSASSAGATSRDNPDTFGADQGGLTLACNDRIFADGFGTP